MWSPFYRRENWGSKVTKMCPRSLSQQVSELTLKPTCIWHQNPWFNRDIISPSEAQPSPQGFSSTETRSERWVWRTHFKSVWVPLHSSPSRFLHCPTTTTLKSSDLPTNPSLPTSFRAILSASTEELPWAMLAKGPACTKTGVPCGSRRTSSKPQRQMKVTCGGPECWVLSRSAFITTTSLMHRFSQRKSKRPESFKGPSSRSVLLLHLMLDQGEKAQRPVISYGNFDKPLCQLPQWLWSKCLTLFHITLHCIFLIKKKKGIRLWWSKGLI